MSNRTRFEWFADEDDSIFDADSASSRRQTRFWKRSGFWMLLLLVFILTVFYGFLSRKQLALKEKERQEVIVGFELWLEAVMSNDSELFNLTLSKEDRIWQQTQKKLFAKGLILNGITLGLELREGGIHNPVAELSPDLKSAILSFEQSYLTNSLQDERQIATLLHTLIYNKQGDRWLSTAGDNSFWGEWQNYDGKFLIVEYPERDDDVSRRIAQKLNAHLKDICLENINKVAGDSDCSSSKPITLVMSTDPASLEALTRPVLNISQQSKMTLPTPSLVGLPVDEGGFDVVYEAYAKSIVSQYEAMVNVPLSLPEEAVYSLCFNFPAEGLRLFRYEPRQDSWQAVLPERNFYSLRALPDDSGVILHEVGRGDEQNRLRLIQLTSDDLLTLLDESSQDRSFRPIGWAKPESTPRLLLQSSYRDQTDAEYGWIATRSCADNACEILKLPGYASWSFDGEYTLLVNGSTILRGDKLGQDVKLVGQGFNPFWIDQETFGFIRFTNGTEGLSSELVLGRIFESEQAEILDSNYLGRLLGLNSGADVFIQHASISPVDSNLLILSASGVRDLSGEFFIFSYHLSEEENIGAGGEGRLLLRRKGFPGGTPASLTPTGFPPFEISPNGRWLLVSELDSDKKSTWTFFFLGLGENQTNRMTESFPVLPAQFPFYDWSMDGEWLVIADHGFFRIVAPEYDYERLIPHNFDSCGFTVWSK